MPLKKILGKIQDWRARREANRQLEVKRLEEVEKKVLREIVSYDRPQSRGGKTLDEAAVHGRIAEAVQLKEKRSELAEIRKKLRKKQGRTLF